MKLEVRMTLDGREWVVGHLLSRDRRIFFEYTPEFRANGWELSPFHLPLKPGVFEEKLRVFQGLHGLFYDSLPDGWGLLLMDRFFRKIGVEPSKSSALDRLAYIGKRGMGALTFHPARHFEEGPVESTLDLESLIAQSERILSGSPEDVLPELLLTGGSPGGARPKILVGLSKDNRVISGVYDLPEGYEHYLIKFSGREESGQAGAIEHAYAAMARAADIQMPETRLLEVGEGRRVFAIKRFDREGKRRIHVQTLGALIHADHRIPNCDYETYLKVTWLLTRNVQAVKQVFRRMVFNVLAHNKDDHVKNFSFLQPAKGEWQPSPAYDLVFSHGMAGEHTMTLAGEGKRPGKKQFLILAEKVELEITQTLEVMEHVRETVSRWRDFAGQSGVSLKETKRIEQKLGM